MTTGRYIDFKRFSIHDGPGIRTTLFLKGCTLGCKWCHNPESIAATPELGIQWRKCVHCGECGSVCACHQFPDGKHAFRRERCNGCGRCVGQCLSGALELFGKTITVEEAKRKLLEDRIFYQASGGGVTLSGGEPLVQADFAAGLLRELAGEKLHRAVDTCGNIPWHAFEKVLPYTDLFLYDYKVADPQKHAAFTGSDNRLLCENLKRLDNTGKPIEIRMIMIPGWNMAEEDLAAAARFLRTLTGVTEIKLLAYHALAHAKYAAVGHEDTMPDAPSPTADALEGAAAFLRESGLNAVRP